MKYQSNLFILIKYSLLLFIFNWISNAWADYDKAYDYFSCKKAKKIYEGEYKFGVNLGDKEKPSPEGRFATGTDCNLLLVGKKNCQVEVECNFIDLRMAKPETGACDDDEFMEISDGVTSEERFCNVPGKLNVKPAGNLQDMYIRVQTKNSTKFKRKFKGYNCVAKCYVKGSPARMLAPIKKKKISLTCVCGMPNDRDRIVGGSDAKLGEFPWQAAIVLKGTRKPFCGSALISDQYILTAAHCFALGDVTEGKIDVLLHALLLDAIKGDSYNKDAEYGTEGWYKSSGWDKESAKDKDENTLRFAAEQILFHPLFTRTYDYDVALVKLDKKINFQKNPDLATLCIPNAGRYDDTYDKSLATVVGWGLASETAGSSTRIMQKLDVPVINYEQCEDIMKKNSGKNITDRMFCAGYLKGGRDACKGDSGGPLLLKNQHNKQSTQIGIVSWGDGCARKNSPGMYAKLTQLVQWVYYHTRGTTWCGKDINGKPPGELIYDELEDY